MEDTPESSESDILNDSPNAEQAEKLIVQKLYKQTQGVMAKSRELITSPNYSKFGPLRGYIKDNRLTVHFSTYGLQHSELHLNGTMIEIADNQGLEEYSGNNGSNSKVRIGIPAYTDLETRDKYLDYIEKPNINTAMLAESLRTFYLLDSEGNLEKFQQTDVGFDSGKPEYWVGHQYFSDTHGFASDVEKGDFELIQTAVNLTDNFLTTGEEVPPPQK